MNNKLQKSKSDGGKGECPLCKIVFDGGSILKQHILASHPNVRPHRCKICHKIVIQEIPQNCRTLPFSKPDRCSECYKVKIDVPMLRFLLDKERIADIPAATAGVSGFSKKTFSKKDTIQQVLTCWICDKSYSRKGSLKVHMESHYNQRKYTCEHCGKSFNRKDYMKVHIKFSCPVIHSKRRPLIHSKHWCEHCNRAFSKLGLKHHIATHKTFPCKACNEIFKSIDELLVHSRQCKSVYLCQTCGKSFQSQMNLKQHLETHSTGISYSCEKCDAAFKTSVYRDYHMQNNCEKGDKIIQFHCKKCNKVFVFLNDIVKHDMLIHRGENFMELFVVYVHKNTETRKISIASTMKVQIYEGPVVKKREELFFCTHCNGVFQKDYSKWHNNHVCSDVLLAKNMEETGTVTNEKSIHCYTCTFCGHIFASYDHLSTHVQGHRYELTFSEKNEIIVSSSLKINEPTVPVRVEDAEKAHIGKISDSNPTSAPDSIAERKIKQLICDIDEEYEEIQKFAPEYEHNQQDPQLKFNTDLCARDLHEHLKGHEHTEQKMDAAVSCLSDTEPISTEQTQNRLHSTDKNEMRTSEDVGPSSHRAHSTKSKAKASDVTALNQRQIENREDELTEQIMGSEKCNNSSSQSQKCPGKDPCKNSASQDNLNVFPPTSRSSVHYATHNNQDSYMAKLVALSHTYLKNVEKVDVMEMRPVKDQDDVPSSEEIRLENCVSSGSTEQNKIRNVCTEMSLGGIEPQTKKGMNEPQSTPVAVDKQMQKLDHPMLDGKFDAIENEFEQPVRIKKEIECRDYAVYSLESVPPVSCVKNRVNINEDAQEPNLQLEGRHERDTSQSVEQNPILLALLEKLPGGSATYQINVPCNDSCITSKYGLNGEIDANNVFTYELCNSNLAFAGKSESGKPSQMRRNGEFQLCSEKMKSIVSQIKHESEKITSG